MVIFEGPDPPTPKLADVPRHAPCSLARSLGARSRCQSRCSLFRATVLSRLGGSRATADTSYYSGKYLNNYGTESLIPAGTSYVPNGWDEWRALVGNSKYYDFGGNSFLSFTSFFYE